MLPADTTSIPHEMKLQVHAFFTALFLSTSFTKTGVGSVGQTYHHTAYRILTYALKSG